MTETAMAESKRGIVRSPKVLVPLIKADLQMAAQAGVPYLRAAGEKMLEAKSQIPHGKFQSWIRTNFKIKLRQAQYYMGLVEVEKRTPVRFSSLDDFRRRHLGEDRTPGSQRDKSWQDPVKQIMNRVDVETLNLHKAELARAEERKAQYELAIQLIDIGYKVLAIKLHPDKGGSRDAMSRLNLVRDRLKNHA
jgi:hypothetical protein